MILGDRRVPFYATSGAIAQAKRRAEEELPEMKQAFAGDFPGRVMFPTNVVSDGDTMTLGGADFQVRHYGACESDDDSIWILQHEGVQHVFAGDLIYNHMHLFMSDGHAENWLAGLRRLLREFDVSARLYPSHGEVCGTEVIYWVKGYIEMYVATLRELLRGQEELSDRDKAILLARMRSYLPSEDLMGLAQWGMDAAVRNLAASFRNWR